MTNSVERVEGEGEGNKELASNLESNRGGSNGRHNGGGIKPHTDHGTDSVGHGTGIESCQSENERMYRLEICSKMST